VKEAGIRRNFAMFIIEFVCLRTQLANLDTLNLSSWSIVGVNVVKIG
jgi:hypothetical protein